MRKLHLAFLYPFLLLCSANTVFGVIVPVPPLGSMVRQADTIVRGYFSFSEEGSVIFHVEASLKGGIQPFREIEITSVIMGRSSAHNLPLFIAEKIQGKPCLVLGNDRNGQIDLPWYTSSIWTEGGGISKEWSVSKDIHACEEFVRSIMEYDRLGQGDESQLARQLLSDLDDITRRSFVLGYVNSRPPIFLEDKVMEHDLLSVVAAHISSQRIYDDWSLRCMWFLAPRMPQSIIIPYLLEVAATGSVQQSDIALSEVKASLRGRRLLESGVSDDLAALSGNVSKALPSLRAIDGRNNLHLFDARLDEVASAAPSVFSQIYDEPRPSGLSAHEEKRFWKNKVR